MYKYIHVLYNHSHTKKTWHKYITADRSTKGRETVQFIYKL